ncbi:nucleotide disphospho-sugar-binding domain-containing protein [Streptomyces sp. NPDC096068]|uniref:nucleotide disphospho-sugar-binding domain-containing protein n=1 Tax=Streptomyces sp. NPDC096068 TaxID=3155424 RepID=UPI00331CDCA8
MRVMFTIWPGTAHLFPLTPLAWALQSAGHEVCVAAHPSMAEGIASVGLTPVPLGDLGLMPTPWDGENSKSRDVEAEMDRLTEDLALEPEDRYPWESLRTFLFPVMWDFHPIGEAPAESYPWIDRLVEAARDWRPDLVLWDPCWPSSAVAARASGAAHARLLWGLDYWGWTVDRFADRGRVLGSRLGTNPMEGSVRAIADRYGMEVDDELLLGQWTVDPTPSGMRLPTRTRTLPMQWMPYTGAAPIPDWLYARPERPRVTMSLGMSMRAFFEESRPRVEALLETVDGMDIEVVATFNKDQLRDIPVPDNVRTVDYLPLNLLLPSSAALIHHGGTGSFNAAAAMGVPQLITSDANDFTTIDDEGNKKTFTTQHMDVPPTTKYLVERGAGFTLDHGELSRSEMRERLERAVSDPSIREGARSLRKDIVAAPTPTEIIPVLERLTEVHRSRT